MGTIAHFDFRIVAALAIMLTGATARFLLAKIQLSVAHPRTSADWKF
jgi:hypothetical protein